MKYLYYCLLFTLLTGNASSINDISNVEYNDKDNVLELLTYINDGYKIVYDYCENIQLDEGYIFKTTKPDCCFNYSYIDSDNNIHLFAIDNNIRLMFKDYKNNVCYKKNFECGEFTIILKLVDIINAAINIITTDIHNVNIWNNLKVIDFYPQIKFLKYAINNAELITNITLKKEKINMLLVVEKNKLSNNMNKIGVDKYMNNIYNYIGSPINKFGSYVGSFVGSTIGETIDKVIPELNSDTKLIIMIIFIILLKRA